MRLAKRRFAPRAQSGIASPTGTIHPRSAEGQSPKNKPPARIAAPRRHDPGNARSPSAQKSPHNHHMHRQRPMRPQNQRLLNIRRPRRPANQARPPRQRTLPLLPHPRPNRLHIRQNILRPQNRQMQRRQQTRRQRMPRHPKPAASPLCPPPPQPSASPPSHPRPEARETPPQPPPRSNPTPPNPPRKPTANPHRAPGSHAAAARGTSPIPSTLRRRAGIPLRRPRKPRNQTPSFRIRKKPPRKCLPSLAAARNPSRLPFRKNRLPPPQTPQNLSPDHSAASRLLPPTSPKTRTNAHLPPSTFPAQTRTPPGYSSALHAPRNR